MPTPVEPPPKVQALDALIDATRRLFHQLRATAREVHGGSDLTAGLRGVLQELDRRGPRTVPQMARARPVSRQHVQTLVDRLVEEGLVELRPNPAHRRSRLVALTAPGRRRVRAMLARERILLEGLPVAADPDEIRRAAEVLKSFRTALRDPEWRQDVGMEP